MIARYVVGDTLREESLAVLPMKATTRGENLFKFFTEFAKEKIYQWINLFRCVLTVLRACGEKQRTCSAFSVNMKRDPS